VSYGGVSGGTRAVQMTKPILTSLKIMPIPEAVAIPSFTKHIENGVFKGDEGLVRSAAIMLDELSRWSEALKPLRG
jgi:NAD(P)H-dependent FMN reductase